MRELSRLALQAFAAEPDVQPKQKKKKKKRKAKGNGGGNPMGLAQAVQTGTKGKVKKRVESGEVRVSRSEYLVELTTAAATGLVRSEILLRPASFPWLSNISKAFEMYKWEKLVFEYRPSVGAATDGNFAMAADWGSKSLADAFTRAQLFSLTPSVDTPVWSPVKSFSLPKNRLQTRTWYFVGDNEEELLEQAPGWLAYIAKTNGAKTVGEIWVHYTVCLAGTRPVA